MLALFYLESMYLASFFESRVSHHFAECRPFLPFLFECYVCQPIPLSVACESNIFIEIHCVNGQCGRIECKFMVRGVKRLSN